MQSVEQVKLSTSLSGLQTLEQLVVFMQTQHCDIRKQVNMTADYVISAYATVSEVTQGLMC